MVAHSENVLYSLGVDSLKLGVTILIGSTALLAGALFLRRPPATLTTQGIADIAAKDDPTIRSEAPLALRSRLSSDRAWVIYLPECTTCTMEEALPDNFSPSISPIVFVKRTNGEIPAAVEHNPLVIDSDGTIQRALNAFRTPRVYFFSQGHLTDIQALSESWSTYLERHHWN